MDSPTIQKMAAPCGIHCGYCECYLAGSNPQLFDNLVAKGIPADRLPCPGCRELEGKCPVIATTCATWECVQKHQVEFCHLCGEFPCEKLQPCADRAAILPHNIKVYSLCKLNRQGLEEWHQDYPAIKKRYYQGKMNIGKGPALME